MLFGSRLNRLATSIRRGISKYSVGSDNPGLVFDFIDNFYQKDKNQTVNFASAITHARSGNAVMTDGYGPELVTNGGFDSDSDWSKGTGWSIADGVATHTGSAGYLQQTGIVETGKVYELSFRITAIGSGEVFAYGINSFGVGGTTTGTYTGLVTATNANIRFRATGEASIDNVSVREMPVLKWAPHNLLSYSEQFDNGYWIKGGTVVTANATNAPDGELSADNVVGTSGVGEKRIYKSSLVASTVGISYTATVYAKANGADWLIVRDDFAGYGDTSFDLINGVVGTVASGRTASIYDAGNGYYACSVTSTVTASFVAGQVMFCLADVDNGRATFSGDGIKGVYLWGAHLYRSDLGGMVDNPDQPLSRASYVPTTSSAKYLPRIGHHVYNGSAWVNEGLLAESESRTNLVTYSDNLLGGSWSGVNCTLTANESVSPDGTENADEITCSGAAGSAFQFVFASGLNGDYVASIYLKAGTLNFAQLNVPYLSTTATANFDLVNGTVNDVLGSGATIEDVGNGWFRCSVIYTTSSQGGIAITPVSSLTATRRDGASGDIYAYGAQLELGSTPSSLIPTSGSTVTRAAETFTIPSANLPWPSPNYIGSELVTNGTFDTDSDWTKGGDWTISGGVASSSGTSGRLNQSTSSVANSNVFIVSLDVVAYTSGTVSVEVGSLNGKNLNVSGTGTYEAVLVSGGSSNIGIYGSSFVGSIDNVSVREIDPLSVSIAMDGRMTYADTGAGGSTSGRQGEAVFYTQFNDASNYLEAFLSTASAAVGEVQFAQESSGTRDTVATAPFSPDILVPFDIASRHGSTFINGAVDGVALTANTTPTSLSDLSATDLSLAYDYMGTIGTFRVWDKDLGDDGIVEATNPSLEPSLSLTFEGTGTNSFVVNNWSE